MHKRILAATIAASVALVPTAAMAQEKTADDTNVTLTAGQLTISDMLIGDFVGKTLTGAAQKTQASFVQAAIASPKTGETTAAAAFRVSDLRGSGDGWNVTLAATQMKEYQNGNAGPDGIVGNTDDVAPGYVTGGRTLPKDNLNVDQAAIAAVADSSLTNVTAVTADNRVADSGAAISVASAAAGAGLGHYDFSFAADALDLGIPADAYAAQYRSDVTVDLVSGPAPAQL